MKTFKQFIQFINESAEKSRGRDTIEKVCDYLRVNAKDEELFKADRIENINDVNYLIYTFDKDKFEGLSGISLNDITLENFTSIKFSDRKPDVVSVGDNGTMEIDWIDTYNGNKWGIFRKFDKDESSEDYVLIFIADENTNRISAIEYGKNVEHFQFGNPEKNLVDTKACLDTNADFQDLWRAYHYSSYRVW